MLWVFEQEDTISTENDSIVGLKFYALGVRKLVTVYCYLVESNGRGGFQEVGTVGGELKEGVVGLDTDATEDYLWDWVTISSADVGLRGASQVIYNLSI